MRASVRAHPALRLHGQTRSGGGRRIEPKPSGCRQVTDYEYTSEFLPDIDDYDEHNSSICDVCGTIYNLSAEDMLIDFRLTALAYTDGSFERFD